MGETISEVLFEKGSRIATLEAAIDATLNLAGDIGPEARRILVAALRSGFDCCKDGRCDGTEPTA